MRAYRLVCCACGTEYDDDGLRLACDAPHEPSLLRTVYQASGLHARHPAPAGSVFRFAWLPVVRAIPGSPGPVACRAEELGRALGLSDLWISFSGHWPERGALLPTGTFKDLEAGVVLGRLPDDPPVLVLASAGNTAAAFAAACVREGARCLIVVPSYAVGAVSAAAGRADGVGLIVVEGGTYDDAIALAEAVGALDGFRPEGGIRNVGRRDGLATCLLSVFEASGRLPRHYVQAVGSGAGAVAAHEAAGRLRKHGCPDPLPRLLLCQNAPYAPLRDAWHGRRTLAPAGPVVAPELTNGRPPFAVRGGVREALVESGGTVVVAGGDEARRAMALFERTEGVDIEPAAGVALAGLAKAVRAGRIGTDDMVLLNITGGGRRRLCAGSGTVPVRPDVSVDVVETRDPALLEIAAKSVADAFLA
ncbi:cysteate synthase [Streptomyces sp. ISL-12]|uniref:cysteate synthase n=1 Tax=Streptomyces sp. ISL-12 TaxID=2819177 RepID=UPI001BECCF72|nr:cysteate synthase [Streptomyces sp. ISL-12]MBT2414382.1 cysteate synthase [Streptomyces sp. ISL-12]